MIWLLERHRSRDYAAESPGCDRRERDLIYRDRDRSPADYRDIQRNRYSHRIDRETENRSRNTQMTRLGCEVAGNEEEEGTLSYGRHRERLVSGSRRQIRDSFADQRSLRHTGRRGDARPRSTIKPMAWAQSEEEEAIETASAAAISMRKRVTDTSPHHSRITDLGSDSVNPEGPEHSELLNKRSGEF
ncbi:unnamed protein product [Protopolystoma xenopodis]|uniref:Uncharacterized protein n=1 Tax=Protopolystoma xenopodis TaxID=117903 RepID=A0A448X5Q7_9PLAT|nr:unnamed protein product [Protopolystoma xenopodis]